MSCGDPHDIDCRAVLEEVYLYLDGEMDSSRFSLIREHLDDCSPCLRLYGIEQDVKTLIARCCGNDPAPEQLRARVLMTLQSVRIEMDTVEFRAE